MTTNRETFTATLAAQYLELFPSPSYDRAAARLTSDALAEIMTSGLLDRTADKDGERIKCTCKALGVKYTYKAIAAYLNGEVS